MTMVIADYQLMSDAESQSVQLVVEDDVGNDDGDNVQPIVKQEKATWDNIKRVEIGLKIVSLIWKFLFATIIVFWTCSAQITKTHTIADSELAGDDDGGSSLFADDGDDDQLLQSRAVPPFKISLGTIYFLVHFFGTELVLTVASAHILMMESAELKGNSLLAARVLQFLMKLLSYVCLGGVAGQYLSYIQNRANPQASWHLTFFCCTYLFLGALGIQVGRNAFDWTDQSISASEFSGTKWSFAVLRFVVAATVKVLGWVLWAFFYWIGAMVTFMMTCSCLGMIRNGYRIAVKIMKWLPKTPGRYLGCSVLGIVLTSIFSLISVVYLAKSVDGLFRRADLLLTLSGLSTAKISDSQGLHITSLIMTILFDVVHIGLFLAKVIYKDKVKDTYILGLTYSRMVRASLLVATLNASLWYIERRIELDDSLEGEDLQQAEEERSETEAQLAHWENEYEIESAATSRQINNLRQVLY